jgi:hypothetical protein
MNSAHKKSGVAFWATAVVVVALVGYPLSFGPACWILDHGYLPKWSHRPAWYSYEPLIEASRCSHLLSPPLRWWCGIGSRLGVSALMLCDPAFDDLPEPEFSYPPDWDRILRG